jgi:hypothetical protein
MRFAQAHTAVDEQRVVCTAGLLRHSHRRGVCKLVALIFDGTTLTFACVNDSQQQSACPVTLVRHATMATTK